MRVEIVDYSTAFSTVGEILTDEHKANTQDFEANT